MFDIRYEFDRVLDGLGLENWIRSPRLRATHDLSLKEQDPVKTCPASTNRNRLPWAPAWNDCFYEEDRAL